MWPFLRRAKKSDDPASTFLSPEDHHRPRPMKFARLAEDMGDFRDLKRHDTALKFWLPEPAAEALKEIAGRNGESMSEMLRQFLAMYCYGVYAYQVMNDKIPGLFKTQDDGIRFSEAPFEPPPGKKRVDTYWVPELGKNIAPIKAWIPERMRDDLQVLADHVDIPLSQYVREIVISRLLGHGTLPKRPEMLTAEPLPSVEDWCEGRDIPLRQVDEAEYFHWQWGEGKRCTEWVDE